VLDAGRTRSYGTRRTQGWLSALQGLRCFSGVLPVPVLSVFISCSACISMVDWCLAMQVLANASILGARLQYGQRCTGYAHGRLPAATKAVSSGCRGAWVPCMAATAQEYGSVMKSKRWLGSSAVSGRSTVRAHGGSCLMFGSKQPDCVSGAR